MQLIVDRYGPLTIFRLVGRMDLATCTAITPQLERELHSVQALAVDMARVEFMSSAGLRFLLLLQRRLLTQGIGEWAIISVPEPVANTMRVTGFADQFHLSDLSEQQIRDRIDSGDLPLLTSREAKASPADGKG